MPLGADELVLSTDAHGKLDLRVWTATGSLRMASRNGLALDRADLPALIDALRLALESEGTA